MQGRKAKKEEINKYNLYKYNIHFIYVTLNKGSALLNFNINTDSCLKLAFEIGQRINTRPHTIIFFYNNQEMKFDDIKEFSLSNLFKNKKDYKNGTVLKLAVGLDSFQVDSRIIHRDGPTGTLTITNNYYQQAVKFTQAGYTILQGIRQIDINPDISPLMKLPLELIFKILRKANPYVKTKHLSKLCYNFDLKFSVFNKEERLKVETVTKVSMQPGKV